MGTGRHDEGRYMEPLRRLRAEKRMTVRDLAEASGVNKDTITALETGKRKRPHPTTLGRLADALGVPVDELEASTGPKIPKVPKTPISNLSLEEADERLWDLGNEKEAYRFLDSVRRERAALEGWMAAYAAAPSDARFAARQDFERVERNLARASIYQTAAVDHWSKLLDPRPASRKGVVEIALEGMDARAVTRELARAQAERTRVDSAGEAI
jgi:transcriptional regulator with XRE-family HTH domain